MPVPACVCPGRFFVGGHCVGSTGCHGASGDAPRGCLPAQVHVYRILTNTPLEDRILSRANNKIDMKVRSFGPCGVRELLLIVREP